MDLHAAWRARWHPLALVDELGERPLARSLLGEQLVLVRLDGALLLTVDRCPHRLAPLHRGTIEDQQLQCAYHGWRFGPDGACTGIPALGPDAAVPARAGLVGLPVVEADGIVWGALEPPAGPPPSFPERRDGLPTVALRPRTTTVSAGRLLDNFLDLTHFPFLHADTFGTDEAREGGDGELVEHGEGFRHVVEQRFANREDPEVVAGRRPLLQHRTLTYTWTPPFAAHLRIEWHEATVVKALFFVVRPAGSGTSVAYQCVARTDLDGPAAVAEAITFEDQVFDEDLAMLEAYEDPELPLDLRVEVHVRTDKPTVELRRRLAALVQTAAEDQLPVEPRGPRR